MAQETIDFPSQFPDKANPDYRDVILGYDSQSGQPISVRLETLQANSATNIIGVAHPSDSPTGTETNGQGYDVSNTSGASQTFTNFLDANGDPIVVADGKSGVIRKSGGSWEFVPAAVDLFAYLQKSDIQIKYTNLFNKDTITPGFRVSGADGSIIASNDNCYSDFIPVEAGKTYSFKNEGLNFFKVAFYNSSEANVAGSDDAVTSVTIPEGVSFVIVSTSTADIDTVMMVEGTTFPPEYIPFSGQVIGLNGMPIRNADLELYSRSEVDALLPVYERASIGNDTFNPNMVYNGQYLASSDKTFKSGAGYAVLTGISVVPGKTYTFKNWDSSRTEFVGTSAVLPLGVKPSNSNALILPDTFINASKTDGKFTFVAAPGMYGVSIGVLSSGEDPSVYANLMFGEGEDVQPVSEYIKQINNEDVIASALVNSEGETFTANDFATKDQVSNISAKSIKEIKFDGASVWIRTELNDTTDVVQRISLYQSNNGASNIRPVYYMGKFDSITGGTLLNPMNDSTPPLQYPNTVSGWAGLVGLNNLGGNHGVSAIKVTCTHDKTTSDLLSVWSDGTWQYHLVQIIDSTHLLFLSIAQEINGEMLPKISGIDSSTLTHVSGATNTDSITDATGADSPQFPSIKNISVLLKIDGKIITEPGTYQGDLVEIVDMHEVVDMTTLNIANPMVWNDGDTLAKVSITYRFFANNLMQMDYRIIPSGTRQVRDYGFIQIYPNTVDATNTKLMAYMNGLKAIGSLDYKAGVDMSANSSTLTHVFVENDLLDTSKPPSRMTQVLFDASNNPKIATAHGYNPLVGQGRDSARVLNTTGYWYLNGANRKSYPWGFAGRESTGIPIYATAFFSIFDPNKNGLRADYYLHQSADVKLYILETKSAETNKVVKLPKELVGKQIEVFEQSAGITLHTEDYVQAQGIVISATGAGEYLTLKLY